MKYSQLGNTGMMVSNISFGASSLGGVFRSIDEKLGIEAVHTALELGINYLDVAPAYGGTKAETMLGKALKGIPRNHFYISTKVGKNTGIHSYGTDSFDYSAAGILRSLEDSSQRLGIDYFDIVHLHDIEYNAGKHIEWALDEGLQALLLLKKQGKIGAVGIGMYPVDLWKRVLEEGKIDVGLSHNLYCLNDTRLETLLPLASSKGIGIISASPFSSGLLTSRGAPDWHPANEQQRAVFKAAASYCSSRGTSIEKLAFQFATSHPKVTTAMFSSANPVSVRRNVEWASEAMDESLLMQVKKILEPVTNQNWKY